MHRYKLSFGSIATLAILILAVTLSSTRASAQTESVLHDFTNSSTDAGYPRANPTFNKVGNLYGTSAFGGTADGGTVYELTRKTGGWVSTVLYSFSPKPKYGADEISSVVFDKAGNLYGTTSLGGSKNDGRVFKLSPKTGGGWSESFVHTFGETGTDGVSPLGGVIVDIAGNLYGTTIYGGTGTCGLITCGTVFELSPASGGGWTEKILHNFTDSVADGANPYSGLILGKAGNLYGTTYNGGAYGWGTVFELSPASGGTWTETILHSFNNNGTDGALPAGPLTFDAAGNLYGTTSYGGTNYGTIFELTPQTGGGWNEEILYTFIDGNEGSNPIYPGAAVVLDKSGNIYGVTQGGSGLTGTVFELSPQGGGTWAFNVLYDFNDLGTTGEAPVGVILDSHGNLYGVTAGGGTDKVGTAFEITP